MKKQNRLSFLVALIFAITGAAAAQTILFEDNFNSPPLDVTTKWKRGSNSSGVTIQGNYLQLVSQSGQSGWIVTQQAYTANNTSMSIKILRANIYADIGICPTSPALNKPNGIYDEPNYYRFYVGRDDGINQPPYKLYAYRKKGGSPEDTVRTLWLPSPYGDGNTPVYMRMRFSEEMIFFEYSLDNCAWIIMYFETFDLPGYSTSNSFYYEIAATDTPVNGILEVDDFKIENYPATNYAA
ncbi:MAG: hypothetical protein ONB42_07285, partial [candidate division KSB1 bacterium]|nr:hypothetical protein [candidate division KSB1 bacterium]